MRKITLEEINERIRKNGPKAEEIIKKTAFIMALWKQEKNAQKTNKKF